MHKIIFLKGLEKINFSGGEPFLPECGHYLGEMVKFCKESLKIPSVSIISNGSLIRESWFKKYGEYLDIMAVSCDSFNEDINRLIGRGQGRQNHIEQLYRVRRWCEKYKVLFKINTVVNTYNYDEDMSFYIKQLNPCRYFVPCLIKKKYKGLFFCLFFRWKVFQCLLLEGENVGSDALRNAERFCISDDLFNEFLKRHKDIKCLVSESNNKMQNSYLILDEYVIMKKKNNNNLLKIHVKMCFR